MKLLCDCLKCDSHIVQSFNDINRPLQLGCKPIYLVNIYNVEQTLASIIEHLCYASGIFVFIREGCIIEIAFDDFHTFCCSLGFDLMELRFQVEGLVLRMGRVAYIGSANDTWMIHSFLHSTSPKLLFVCRWSLALDASKNRYEPVCQGRRQRKRWG